MQRFATLHASYMRVLTRLEVHQYWLSILFVFFSFQNDQVEDLVLHSGVILSVPLLPDWRRQGVD